MNRILLTFTVSLAFLVQSYGQSFSNGEFTWDLNSNHDYPTYFDIQFQSRGWTAYSDENIYPRVKNLSIYEVEVVIEFEVVDYCSESRIFYVFGTVVPGGTLNDLQNFDPICKEVKEVSKVKTKIQSVNCRVTKFRNLTKEIEDAKIEREKKQEELELKRKKEAEAKEQAKRVAEEKKLAEAKKIAEEKKVTEDQETNGTENASENKDNEGVSTTKKEETSVAIDDFWNDSPKASQSKPKQKTNEEIVNESRASVQKQTDDFWKEKAASDIKAKELGVKYEQSFYAANRLRDAKDNLDEATTLNAENYATVEELEAAFRQKMNSINNAVSEVTNAKNQQLQANVDVMWANSNPSDQAVGDFVAAAGSIINSIGEEKRKREAKEQLEIDKNNAKAKMEAEINAEKRRLKLELRNYFIGEFKDGGVPLSSHKVESDELYFFSFIFDQNTIENDTPVLYLTGVFPIARYKDGTWPFKNNLVSEIKKLAIPGTVTLMGYYTAEEMATQTRNTFVNMANQSGFVLKDIVYKGKKSSGTKTEGDFWETKKKSGETKTDTDFWETPGKTTDTKTNKKETKKDDFWND